MEKFEALFSKKKKKEEVKEIKPDDIEAEGDSGLQQAETLNGEIIDIVRGRDFEDLELSELTEVLSKYKQMENVLGISSEKKVEGTIQEQMDMAKEVMGGEFFGVQEVKRAFGIEVKPEDIPEIPFAREDLERARELNQFLVLRANKAADGELLSLQKINKILKGKVTDGSKLLYSDDGKGGVKSDAWYKDEAFSKEKAPEFAWALVSKEVIPNSTSKNYLEQIEELVSYIKNSVFQGREVSAEYQEAIDEFEKEKSGIGEILSSDWKSAAEKLSSLKVNRLVRQNPAEVLYDIAMYFQNKGERILEDKYSWTHSRTSYGGLVDVGAFDADGVDVYRWTPDGSYDDLGVVFSRSLCLVCSGRGFLLQAFYPSPKHLSQLFQRY